MFRPKVSGSRLLAREVFPLKWAATATLAILLISVSATLVGPLIVQQFIDRAQVGGTSTALIGTALCYLAIGAVGGLARATASYLGVRFAWRVADRLRSKLLRHFTVATPVLELERTPTGEVLEKVEGAADVVARSISDAGLRLVGNIAITVGVLGILFVQIPGAGAGIGLLVVVTCLVLTKLGRIAARRWEVARDQQTELFGFIGDVLGARTDLRALGQQGWATDRTSAGLDQLYGSEGKAYIGGRAFWPVTQLFIAVSFGLGFGFGLQQLGHGGMTVGMLTVIYLYVDLLQKPMEEMSSQAGLLQEMVAVLTIAARTLDIPAAPPPASGTPVLPPGPLDVRFDGVTFGYGDRLALTDVSFDVAAGTSLGIVGRTGAGKSTVVNLLCGLARPNSGQVYIGGVPVTDIPPAEFAQRVTVMSQRAHVFAATVLENITLFDDTIDRESVWQVLRRLRAADWVRLLPDGLDTVIGAGGRTLSAGELQLIAGARALIRPYSLLIVDEGTSRLDADIEQSWADLIDEIRRDRTVVLVEHRERALARIDRVLTMHDGRVLVVDSAITTGDMKEANA
ncbi:Lipid A export ATP-binding/permease protein MsbA [Nocardia gamkensis]|uniref:ABC transporter ATP-binding protein n=1 Tax=Nocardia gamkensis TaxID=352869 RepID=A0A7X6R789_9NOCA|nr:ABC transporter ATP-binding protein [Nocardia gamkensis]NKY31211.1 ABC transporter ATP-binding protein [Nocardia gamkensis]NQE71949.1 Lipid A export ATP-binding/permease protein MsbA [Nocardia gamkensis]